MEIKKIEPIKTRTSNTSVSNNNNTNSQHANTISNRNVEIETINFDNEVLSTSNISKQDVQSSIEMNLENNRDLSNQFTEAVYKGLKENLVSYIQNGEYQNGRTK